jgi:hypothetical protein
MCQNDFLLLKKDSCVSLRQPKPFELGNTFKCSRFCEVVDRIHTNPGSEWWVHSSYIIEASLCAVQNSRKKKKKLAQVIIMAGEIWVVSFGNVTRRRF